MAPCSIVPLRRYLQRHDVAVLHVMRQGGVDQHDVGTFIHDDHDKHGQLAKHLQKEWNETEWNTVKSEEWKREMVNG